MSYLVPIPVRNDIPNLLVMILLRIRIPKCLTLLLFRVQERGQVSAARFVPLNISSGWIPDKRCCKLNGRNYTSAGALPQV